jgi:hypothetical protein
MVSRNSRAGVVIAAAVVAVLSSLGLTGAAGAKGQANTTVTIDGGGGLVQGYVNSPNENKCANNRKVLIFQVKNGDSEQVATDRAQQDGDRYQWGKGFEGGKYFAKVNPNDDCKGDKTKTVKAGHL